MTDQLTTPGGASMPVSAPAGYAGLFAVMAPAGYSLPVTTSEGASSISTNQVSVGAGGNLIVPARAGRKGVIILNEGATDVRLGPSGVTAATGLLLTGVKGAGVTIDGGAAVYGIVATGTQVVSYMEIF